MQTDPANPSSVRRTALWSWFWAVLAVVQVTQAVWVNGGRAYPGDLGDGRFNQLVLEHGYQAIRGWADWASPRQFYPVQDTLAYSDTHAGTLPLYAGLRFLSISREEAWQLWFVVVASLNVLAAFRLFRALEIAAALRGPLVFAAAGSAILVWQTGTHPQLLPVFPALLAWEQGVRWVSDRYGWRWLAAAGWLAWQFAAGPYSAFFAVALAGLVAALLGCSRPAARLEPSALSSRPGRHWAVLTFLAGGALAGAAGWIYLSAPVGTGAHALSEVVDLAPTPASWFTSAPTRLLYPIGWPARATNLAEHALFAGFLPLIVGAAAGVLGWRHRREPAGAWALALATSAFVTALGFTRWSQGFPGVWVWLAAHLEPLRAFRAAGRIAELLNVLLVGSAGLLLTRWRQSSATRWAMAGPIALSCALAVENISWGQPATRTATARARTDAVVAAWRQAGDRPVLAYAPGFTNQPELFLHLDAWSAALQLHRFTVNGYTGGIPSSHMRFALLPTAANARALVQAAGVPESHVSIVQRLAPDAETRIGLLHFSERPVPRLVGFDLQPVGWDLSTPLERFVIDGGTWYQFTPPAEVRFQLPDAVTAVESDFLMRPGSCDGSGQSDGVDITWVLRVGGQADQVLDREVIDPRRRPSDRGVLHRVVRIPAARGRQVLLRVDVGPAGNGAWDWPLFGGVRAR